MATGIPLDLNYLDIAALCFGDLALQRTNLKCQKISQKGSCDSPVEEIVI